MIQKLLKINKKRLLLMATFLTFFNLIVPVANDIADYQTQTIPQ